MEALKTVGAEAEDVGVRVEVQIIIMAVTMLLAWWATIRIAERS